jgi:hypothetical protein
LRAIADDIVNLILMPIPGVSNRHPGSLSNRDRLEFLLRGVDRRLQVPEVRGADRYLSSEHYLVLVHTAWAL